MHYFLFPQTPTSHGPTAKYKHAQVQVDKSNETVTSILTVV